MRERYKCVRTLNPGLRPSIKLYGGVSSFPVALSHPGVGQSPGHRSAQSADGLQGPFAQGGKAIN